MVAWTSPHCAEFHPMEVICSVRALPRGAELAQAGICPSHSRLMPFSTVRPSLAGTMRSGQGQCEYVDTNGTERAAYSGYDCGCIWDSYANLYTWTTGKSCPTGRTATSAPATCRVWFASKQQLALGWYSTSQSKCIYPLAVNGSMSLSGLTPTNQTILCVNATGFNQGNYL